ncbi:hypothetical protein D3C80_260920 [compost metagenome]
MVVPEAEPVKVKTAPLPPKIAAVDNPAVIDAISPESAEDDADAVKNRTAHIIVDDPGVDESKSSQKAPNGLRLF